METKNIVIGQFLSHLLQTLKVGVLVKGVDNISPSVVLKFVRDSIPDKKKLYSSVVGYDSPDSIDGCTISNRIEDAVLWRSDPSCTGGIIIFIKEDSAKLHSLGDFDVITDFDLSNFVIQNKENSCVNKPSKEFWHSLLDFSNTFTYDMLEQFIREVEKESDTESAISDNLWHLNLLPDRSMFDSNVNKAARLKDNFNKIIEIGQLSEEARKRLSRSLLHTKSSDAESLKLAYSNLQNYFKFGKASTLSNLTYSTVVTLLSAANTNKKDKKNNTGTDTSASQVSSKELDRLVNDTIVNGNDESLEGLKDLVDKIREKINNEEDDSQDITGLSGQFEDKTISVVNMRTDLRSLVGRLCSSEHWGGIATTSETVLRDALANDFDSVDFFDPNDEESKYLSSEGMCLFDFIGQFDNLLSLNESCDSFKTTIKELISSREKLLKNLDLIMYYPVLAFGADLSLRSDLFSYIENFGKLYNLFCDKSELMRQKSLEGTDYVAKALLILDVLYIKTPTEWKAVILPLHPMYLWRFYEVFKNFAKEKATLSEENKRTLSDVLSTLPHALNYVIVNKLLAVPEDLTLPCSGNIEMLPTYENKTNRYLGDDGIQSIPEVLSRWVGFAPYSKSELRICVIDLPNLIASIRELKKFMDENNCTRVVYDVYYTRKQNGNNELAKLDFSSKDSELAQYIKDNRISITIKNCSSIEDVSLLIAARPVHVAFFFDQSAYKISYVPNNQNLYINPLVITYDYDYDEAKHRGRLYPSTESESGIIGDYHHLLRVAHVIESNTCPSVIASDNAHINTIVSTIKQKSVQWLVVADRDTNNYNPSESIPIGESKCGKRMVKVWTDNESRIISQYESILRLYSLHPNRTKLVNILSDFGHIASTGLISIPKYGSDPTATENKRKGLLGTLFASVWYTRRYPGSLIASLDDETSRLWLHNNDQDNNRADLIGLHYDEIDDTLYIQPIEVKTRDENPDAQYDSSRVISGHAADQIASVIKTLNDIFSLDDINVTDMFISARREILKYQIVSECFRNIHDQEWQKKWCDILKRSFGRGKKLDIKVSISGILVFVKLSESTPGITEMCTYDDVDAYPIEYVKLTSTDVQDYIFDDKSIAQHITNSKIDIENKTSGLQINVSTVAEKTGNESSVVSNNADIVVKDSSSEILDNSETTKAIDDTVLDSNVPLSQKVIKQEEIKQLTKDFINACSSYKISLKECDPTKAVVGPSVIRLSFKLAKGQPIRKLIDSIEDVSREMKRTGVLVQPVKNSDELKLDVPRTDREKVLFSSVRGIIPTNLSPERLPFVLGRTPDGQDLIKDLSDMPHMLVGGSTGSGKSVFLFTLLSSLLLTHPNKEDMQLILSSSKLEDFSHFSNLPHLYSGKIISDANEAMEVIRDVVEKESERRMNLLTEAHVANIKEYNSKMDNKLCPIVVVIDEFADLSDQLSTKQEKDAFYRPVQRIAQAGRSRGIHLVICTQRPEAKLVPPTTKAQLNGRVALRVNDGISSRMIIDSSDAQYLQKYGDMIFKNGDEQERCQGYLITTEELDELIADVIDRNK